MSEESADAIVRHFEAEGVRSRVIGEVTRREELAQPRGENDVLVQGAKGAHGGPVLVTA